MNFFINRYKELGFEHKECLLPKCIRINTLRSDENHILKRIKQKIKIKKIPFLKYGYQVIESEFSVGSTNEYLQGYYYVQESASQLPVEILEPKPDENVLDMCAAPGSKTTQLAQWMENKGKIIALDITRKRLIALENNLQRCGVSNTIVYNKDAIYVGDFGIKFDKILLDAPCSGNYCQESEWFEKRDLNGVKENSKKQKELLQSALNVLEKNGTLVYSTCSLEPEENELNIQWLLDNFDVRLENISLDIGVDGLTTINGKELSKEISKTKRIWPGKTQGFFLAKIKKN